MGDFSQKNRPCTANQKGKEMKRATSGTTTSIQAAIDDQKICGTGHRHEHASIVNYTKDDIQHLQSTSSLSWNREGQDQ